MNSARRKIAWILAVMCAGVVAWVQPEKARCEGEAPEPKLAAADAKDFMGDWALSVELGGSPRQMMLKIADEKGKAVGNLNMGFGPGVQRITDISKADGGLTLKYELNMRGNGIPMTLVLKRDGEKLAGTIGDEDGRFHGDVTGAKADPKAVAEAAAAAAAAGDGEAAAGEDGGRRGGGRRGGGGGGGARGGMGFAGRGSTKATIGGKSVDISFGKALTGGMSYKGFEALKDGEVVRIIEVLPPKMKIETNLQFGDKVIKTENLAKGYPGTYSLWLKKVGDGWRLLFNNQADVWGTQHDAAADVSEVPLTYAKAATEAKELTFELKAEGDAGTLRLAWGPHEWTTKFTAAKNG